MDDEQRRRMLETLERFHAQAEAEDAASGSGSGSEEDGVSDEDAPGGEGGGACGGLSDATLARLAERVQAQDAPLSLDDLFADERRAFLRAVGSGSIRRVHARCLCVSWLLTPTCTRAATC